MSDLERMIERSKGYDQFKADYGPGQVNQHAFTSNAGGQLLLSTPHTLDGDPNADWKQHMPLTDWALKQVCGKLGAVVWPGSSRSIPYDYLTAFPAQRQATQLQYWVDQAPNDREWFLRTYGGEQKSVRAVLTNRYSVVDVTETLEWAQQILKEKNGSVEIFRPYLTADVLHLKLIFRNVQPNSKGPYGIGVYVSTGEIGNRRIEVAPFVMQIACTNSIWWRHEGAWQHPHTGESRVLRQEFLVHMVHALEGSESLLEAMLDAENKKIPDFDKMLDDICERNGWGIGIRDDILKGTERQETVAGMVAGITWAAQQQPDWEAGIDMETVAGEFLWNMTREQTPARR